MRADIGFIGLGAMGTGMAQRLMGAGHRVTVHDADAKKLGRWREEGVTTAASPRELARRCNVIFLSLPGDEVTEEVCLDSENGLIAGWKTNGVLIDLGTSQPASSVKIAEALQERGGRMLDAPVSGGENGAAHGKLSIMVGGPLDLYKEMQPLLRILGRDVAHVGPNGCGQAIKGVNQMVMGLADAVFMEALAYAMAYDVAPETIAEVLKNAYASQVSFLNVARKAAEGHVENADVKLAHLRRFVPDAQGKGLNLPAATAVLEAANAAPQVEGSPHVVTPDWPANSLRPSYWKAIWNEFPPKTDAKES